MTQFIPIYLDARGNPNYRLGSRRMSLLEACIICIEYEKETGLAASLWRLNEDETLKEAL